MFCRNCGSEIDDKAYVCPKCGCLTGTNAAVGGVPVDSNEPANAGLIVLSVLIPLVGVVLGIVNLSSNKKRAGKAYLTAGLVTWGICFLMIISSLVITG